MAKPRVALILGAGFSCEANLPNTKDVAKKFLQTPESTVLTQHIEAEISQHLTDFWTHVFGHSSGRIGSPSLEDHFTVVDSAANSGHHLGGKYDPRKLRAIRRLSIHRIFQILDRPGSSDEIEQLFRGLNEGADFTIVSTNWDIVAENHLRMVALPFRYGWGSDADTSPNSILILKLHGSSNWIYCDLCRTLMERPQDRGKVALREKVFIREDDFRALGTNEGLCQEIAAILSTLGNCPRCGSRPSARVATFSYQKDVRLQQFQAIWHEAHQVLRDAPTWLFIGYSMPEADFELRHLIKSAELVGLERNLERMITVVLLDDPSAAKRYTRFFGTRLGQVCQGGLAAWVNNEMCSWIKDIKTDK